MTTSSLLTFWLILALGGAGLTFAVGYLAGGWSKVRGDAPILARESVVLAVLVGIVLATFQSMGLVTIVLVAGLGVVFSLWRATHPSSASGPMIDPSVLTRRAAVRSPKGRLLLGAYLTLAIAAGLALGVLNPPGSGGRGVWAENQSTADAIFVVLDSDGTILDEYSLPAGASGVPKPQSDVASGHVTEWLVLTTSCTEARTPRPRGGVGPGAIRLLIDPTGAVWQEIADEPQGLGNLASSTACPGPFGVGPPWRPA